MLKLEINRKEIVAEKGLTILQALERSSLKVPRFCFHEKLSIAGNCRMCLVEVGKVAKPVASCTLSISDNMQIFTNTLLVKKAREAVLELLLINHPLDCPICDQGGECDLQDQAFVFGNDKSRFYEMKRAVSDKLISPIVKTIMTRCIHCTRCVRFLNEIAGDSNLGVTGRGNSMEIGNYLNIGINSELSGNIIDLCPVGALTSKSYSFVGRSWELRNYETIDIFDSLGSNIVVQTRGTEILRILPKINELVNEEWITDKVRFSLDGYLIQRIHKPFYQIRFFYNYKFLTYCLKSHVDFTHKINCSWDILYGIFKEQIYYIFCNFNKYILIGNQVNLESLSMLKLFNNYFNFSGYYSQYNVNNESSSLDFQKNYFLNALPKNLERIDICLLIGVNLRAESPLLNSRLRKSYLKFNTIIASIGPFINPIYLLSNLSNSLKSISSIIFGKNKFNENLNNDVVIYSIFGAIAHRLYSNFSFLISKLNYLNFKILNVSTFISSLSSFDLGLEKISSYNSHNDNFYYVLNTDEINLDKKRFNSNNFLMYQGSYYDRNANKGDLVFSVNNFFEEKSTFLNILGDKKKNSDIVAVLRFVDENIRFSYETVYWLLNFCIKNRLLKLYYEFYSMIKFNLSLDFDLKQFSMKLSNIYVNNFINNYYKTDSITRASKLMSRIVSFNSQNSLNLNY